MKKNPLMALLLIIFFVASCSSASSIAPTQTPLPSPTTTLTATSTATSTSTITQTPTITYTPVPSGPCDNPLIPLVTGTSYEYQTTTPSGTARFTFNVMDRADIGNINIEVQVIDHKHGREIKELVICQEGEIVNFPLYVMSMLFVDYFRGILNTYHWYDSASYGPSFATLAGSDWVYTWKPEYLLEENAYFKNPKGGSDLMLSAYSTIHLVFQTEGQVEPVEVPGGAFPEALVVMVDYRIPIITSMGPGGVGGSVRVFTKQWFVPFVGLIRAEIESVEYKILSAIYPATIVSLLELVGYTISP